MEAIMMNSNFPIEVNNEVPHLNENIIAHAEARIRSLATDRRDITGASISLEQLAGGETPYLFRATLVIYMRPENLSTVQKEETAETAIQGALSAAERQVRESRVRKTARKRSEPAAYPVFDMSPRALYDTFSEQADPAILLENDRDSLATKLIVEENLDQETAYYAADRIMEYAQRL
jgi:ribosome-associated translation inhibitor RaiA